MFSKIWEPNTGKKLNPFTLKLTHDPLISNIPFQSHFSFLYIPCLQCPFNFLGNIYLSFQCHSQSPTNLKVITSSKLHSSAFLYFMQVTLIFYLYYYNMPYHPPTN